MSYGIDVSYCQEGLDYTLAVAQGYKFCIVRLGYTGSASGRQALDDLFVQNINAAKAAGKSVSTSTVPPHQKKKPKPKRTGYLSS